MQILWLLVDVVIGLVVAGAIAPFVVTALSERAAGPELLVVVAAVCVVVVSLLRRAFVPNPGARAKH